MGADLKKNFAIFLVIQNREPLVSSLNAHKEHTDIVGFWWGEMRDWKIGLVKNFKFVGLKFDTENGPKSCPTFEQRIISCKKRNHFEWKCCSTKHEVYLSENEFQNNQGDEILAVL